MPEETVWLTVKEFAYRQNRSPVSIWRWCDTGFIIELGYLLHRDITGRILIGIPPAHPGRGVLLDACPIRQSI